MDPQQPSAPQNSTSPQHQASTSAPMPPKKYNTLALIITAIILLLGVVAVIVFLWLKPAGSPAQNTNSNAQAEQLFYDTIQNASKQPIFRVGMYRGYFASEADANQDKLAAVWSNVGELDTAKSDYRSLYIYRYAENDKFTVGRCVSGKDMRAFLTPNADMPTTMDGAVALLTNKLQAAGENLSMSPCPLLGVYPSGTIDLAPARMNDGVFPVGFGEDDATKWVQDIKTKKLFDIKDEGQVTKDGKSLRKISFAPKAGVTDVNKQLFTAFQAVAGEVSAKNAYSFITIGYINQGGIKGYYLIDESKKLPVYSELTNTDIEPSEGATLRSFNVIRTKQNYSYGGPLTLDATTQPDFVK